MGLMGVEVLKKEETKLRERKKKLNWPNKIVMVEVEMKSDLRLEMTVIKLIRKINNDVIWVRWSPSSILCF